MYKNSLPVLVNH